MAIQINLLPWREEKRAHDKKISIGFLVAGGILALALTGVAYYLVQASIGIQESNYSTLNAKNNIVLKDLAVMKEIDAKRQLLNQQIESIEKLQSSRGDFLHIIESLTNAVIGRDVFITKFDYNSSGIKISGVAKNEKSVADFMSGLTSSGWFTTPELVSTKSKTNLEVNIREFDIVSKPVLKESKNKGSK